MKWFVDDEVRYSEIVGIMVEGLTAAVRDGKGEEDYGVCNPKTYGETGLAEFFTKEELLRELTDRPSSDASHVFVDRFCFSRLKE